MRLDPWLLDPWLLDPRLLDPRLPDPRRLDPRLLDPRRLDPWLLDLRLLDLRLLDPRRLDPGLAAGLRSSVLQGRGDLLFGVVVIKLPQIGDQRRGQRQLLDVVDPDQLSDAEATEMLQRLDAAEPGDRVQELDRGRG